MISNMYLALNENITKEQYLEITKKSAARKTNLLKDFEDRLKGKSDEERRAMIKSAMPVLMAILMF